MNVAELIEWLETQDQGAIVEIVYHPRGTGYDDQGGNASVEEFNPNVNKYGVADHWHYTDFRGNQAVKETKSYYNKRYLLLGGIDQ